MKKILFIALTIIFLISINNANAMNYNDWFTAYHETIICVDEDGLQPGMITYPMKPEALLQQQVLGKANFKLKRNDETFLFNKAKDAGFIRTVYGFRLTGTVENVKYDIDCAPMIFGRDTDERNGGMVIEIKVDGCQSSDEIIINYGGLARGEFVLPHVRYKLHSSDEFTCTNNNIITKKEGYAIISNPDLSATVGISGKFEKNSKLNIVQAKWNPGKGKAKMFFIVAFAKDSKKLPEILSKNPEKELQKSHEFFEKISELAVIKTPIKNIDEAFKWGVLCLEYCYYEPLGWIESLDHWLTLYSMMYPRVADDIDQIDRSKFCLLEHAKNIDESGRIRNLCPSGKVRIDFLWNHHFLWDIEHYLDRTGDIETVREIYEPTKKVYENTFKTYDKDGNFLLGFDQQIGYQEDFVNTPNDGGSASMAGIEMLRIMGKLANTIGKKEEAAEFLRKEKIARSRIEKEIWIPELGRFLYYKDHYGKKHWDGQYHTFSWPSLYNFSDDMGKYTSLRHLKDTLISPQGLVYVSKNFPTHVGHTTGCQEAAAQTPIAAQGLSMGGMRKAGAKMFESFADLVMSPENMGCYPETAPTRGTWFSPTASFYLEGIIEGLFGLRFKDGGKLLIVTPGIPNDWTNASIKLPSVSADFKQTKNSRQLVLTTKENLPAEINWTLPLSDSYSVKVNGKKVSAEFSPAVNGVKIKIKVADNKKQIVKIDFKPSKIKIKYPKNIEEGSDFYCEVKNTAIIGIEDPSKLLTSISYTKNKADLKLSTGLMDNFLKFGYLGEKTFSRRTFFLKLQAGKFSALYPINFTIKPSIILENKKETVATGNFSSIPFERNQSSTNWQNFRVFDSALALGLTALKDPLADLVSKGKKSSDSELFKVTIKEAGNIPFDVQPKNLLLLSDRVHTPSESFRVDKKARKLHFLIVAFVNNKDVFSEVGEIIVRCASPKGEHAVAPPEPHLIQKMLYYPGNVDNWMPTPISHTYDSYGKGWSTSPALSTSGATFSIITIDLEKVEFVESITISSKGRMPAIGIVGISSEL